MDNSPPSLKEEEEGSACIQLDPIGTGVENLSNACCASNHDATGICKFILIVEYIYLKINNK